MARLTGKVALITGTGAGMGRAAALRFAAEGTTVVGCELNPQTSAETVRLVHEAGGTMTSTAPVDLSSFEATPSRCRQPVGAGRRGRRGRHARRLPRLDDAWYSNAATIPVDGG